MEMNRYHIICNNCHAQMGSDWDDRWTQEDLIKMWNLRAATPVEDNRPIKHWEVEVRVNGESVLTIGHNHLSGADNIDDYANEVRECAYHLLSFIGETRYNRENHMKIKDTAFEPIKRRST
jgi:hypothetical protein